MLKKVLRKQNGFTLVEFLIAMTIAATLFTAVIYFFRNSTVISSHISNETIATNELKNAFNSFDRDVQQASTVSTTGPNFLTLTWKANTVDQTKVIYSIDVNNDRLQRNQYLNNVLTSTMNVANNVNSALTDCIWDSTKYNLTINMTVSIGKISEGRQFIITPRVIQASSLLPDKVDLAASTAYTSYGQLVTFTATVTPTTGSDIISSGTVTFVVNGNSVCVSPVFDGVATYPVTNLPAGNYPVIAVYSGDAVYMANTSGEVNQTVNQGTPTLSVTNSPVTYNGSPQPATVIGSVAGTVSNIKYGGSATVPINAGIYTITADFVPTDTTNYSSLTGASAGNFTINKISTTVTLSSSPNPSAPGQLVTFTGTIAPSAATGTVTFKEGASTIGTGNLSNGKATYTTSTMSAGNHSITATYSGDTNYAGSTSSVLPQLVIGGPTVTEISPNSGPTAGGTSVTITGTNFIAGATVTIGGTAATSVNVTNSSTITARTPAGMTGAQDVVVTTSVGSGTLTGGYTYIGTIITSTANGGDWSSRSTWIGGVVPGTGVAVIIATTSGHSVEIDTNLTQTSAGSVIVNSGATLSMQTSSTAISLGALTINNGGTVTAYRDFTVQGATSITGRINFGSTSTTNRTMTFTGDVTLNSGAVWNETTNGAEADFSFGGNFTNNSTTFTAQNDPNAIHTFTGTGKTISGATVTAIPYLTISGTTTNNGTLTITSTLAGSGTLTNGATGILNFAGSSIAPTLTATAVGNTVNYNKAGNQTVKATAYYNLILSGSGAKSIASSSISVASKLTISGATASLNANITSDTLWFVTQQVSGTWGSNSSSAAHKTNTYFTTGTTGIVTVAH